MANLPGGQRVIPVDKPSQEGKPRVPPAERSATQPDTTPGSHPHAGRRAARAAQLRQRRRQCRAVPRVGRHGGGRRDAPARQCRSAGDPQGRGQIPEIAKDAVRSPEITRDAVRSPEIRAEAVRTSEIEDKGVRLTDISDSARSALQGAQGPAGPQGPSGTTAYGSPRPNR